MAQRRISKNQRRKIGVFLRCVLISFIAWLLFAISSDYKYRIKAGISYVNIPEKRAFHPLQSDTVDVEVTMSGWKVFLANLHKDTSTIQVDLSGLANRNFVVMSNQIGFINKQFPADKKVIKVHPDTLFFDFSKQTQRKIPVRVLTHIDFKKQYGIIGETKSNPAYVTVTGPMEDVASIEYLETDSIKGSAIHSDIRTIAYLNRNQKNNITIYPTFTEITIPVGELTEKILEIPLRVENASKYTSVRTLPSKVKVAILVSIKDYNTWTARDFEAVVDMNSWEENHVKSLPVLITRSPEFVKVISVDPANVDFLVRK
ncbi:YbbR-like domain-containing protein [Sphingobacterium hungaricum]|uniref:YbbR-like protein n=1 Tax=Sphingobacterium hungaricum TaxID=2082723 RepID=A0A928UVT6_9SPHI|nr:hypothetical protein [Sphingobacterium hungaricum]